MEFRKKTVMTLILYIFMSVYFENTFSLLCTTACFSGSYCELNQCLPCPQGTYMPKDGHLERFCIAWTKKTGPHVKILQTGSVYKDIEWGCVDGYERKVINALGEWECVKSATSTSTGAMHSTSTAFSITASSTVFTEIADGKQKFQNLEPIHILIIVLGIFLVIALCIKLFIFFKKKKREKKYKKQQLDALYTLVCGILGPVEFKQFTAHLQNFSKIPDTNQNLNSRDECINLLKRWENQTQDLNHAHCIVDALHDIGYVLQIDTDKKDIHKKRKNNKTDIRLIIISLNKAKSLNDKFVPFCNSLCEELGRDLYLIATELSLSVDLKNKMPQYNNDLQLAFSACLSKWSYGYPFDYSNMMKWPPLDKIQEALVKLDRNDFTERISEFSENIFKMFESEAESSM